MTGKEFLKSTVQSFFIVVTCINVALLVLGNVFQPDRLFGYEAFLYPIYYGACSMIPVVLTYSKKELTVKQLIIRKIIQVISINIIVVLLVFGFKGLRVSNAKLIAGVSLSILIICAVEELVSWFYNSHTALRLTDELMIYQSRQDMELELKSK